MAGNTNSLYLFSCTKEPASLVRRELERYYDCSATLVSPGIFLLSLSAPPQQINHFGYVHFVAKVHARTTADDYLSVAKEIKSPYKIGLLQSKEYFSSVKVLADILHPYIVNPVVQLNNPEHEYVFLFTEKELFFTELLVLNTDRPDLRKAHHKKHLHPTSLDPRLAKAMIALSAKQSFHDPFCGVGGIVIEGALQGKLASGSDLVNELVQKAKENAIAAGVENIEFLVADATTLQKSAEVYVSDLPYGKNSLLSETKEVLFTKFFIHAKSQTKLLVLGCDSETPLIGLAEKTGWRCEEQHTIYVHKSLSRIIYVFSLV